MNMPMSRNTLCCTTTIMLQLIFICRAQNEPEVESPCPGITVVNDAKLIGSQVVVNDNFVANIDRMVECAKPDNLKLFAVSSSRCSVPVGVQQVALGITSDHLIGMAIDIQPQLPNTNHLVSKDQMAAAWCAFNMDTEPCKTKYSNNIPQEAEEYCNKNKDKKPCKDYKGYPTPDSKDNVNMIVHRFMVCVAKDSNIELGATFKGINFNCKTTKNKKKVCTPRTDIKNTNQFSWMQDANHFERGSTSVEAYTAYQKLLNQFCSYQCSNAIPHNIAYNTCYKGKYSPGHTPESCFGVGIGSVCLSQDPMNNNNKVNDKEILAEEYPPCSFEARVGFDDIICKQFDQGISLVCSDYLCVPAFDDLHMNCDPLPVYVEDPVVSQLEQESILDEDPELIITNTGTPSPSPTPLPSPPLDTRPATKKLICRTIDVPCSGPDISCNSNEEDMSLNDGYVCSEYVDRCDLCSINCAGNITSCSNINTKDFNCTINGSQDDCTQCGPVNNNMPNECFSSISNIDITVRLGYTCNPHYNYKLCNTNSCISKNSYTKTCCSCPTGYITIPHNHIGSNGLCNRCNASDVDGVKGCNRCNLDEYYDNGSCIKCPPGTTTSSYYQSSIHDCEPPNYIDPSCSSTTTRTLPSKKCTEYCMLNETSDGYTWTNKQDDANYCNSNESVMNYGECSNSLPSSSLCMDNQASNPYIQCNLNTFDPYNPYTTSGRMGTQLGDGSGDDSAYCNLDTNYRYGDYSNPCNFCAKVTLSGIDGSTMQAGTCVKLSQGFGTSTNLDTNVTTFTDFFPIVPGSKNAYYCAPVYPCAIDNNINKIVNLECCSCPQGYIMTEQFCIGAHRKLLHDSCVGSKVCTFCPERTVQVKNTCVRCAVGEWSTYFSTSCNKCPHGTTTINNSPGTSAKDCVSTLTPTQLQHMKPVKRRPRTAVKHRQKPTVRKPTKIKHTRKKPIKKTISKRKSIHKKG